MKQLANDQMVEPLEFAPGTLGAFLISGQTGWPTEYSTQLDGAVVGVNKSWIKSEHQCCSRTTGERPAVKYVRIALELSVFRDGELQCLRVEEMFPGHIMDVLDSPLDEHAAARVRRSIVDTLVALDAEEPVENLLGNCIAPMRLYEPLLNALVQPPARDSLAEWVDQNMSGLLCNEDGELIEVEAHGCLVKVRAKELAINSGLRAQGEIKLVGHVEVVCPQTGQRRGEWKSRAVLMRPSMKLHNLPAPDEATFTMIQDLANSWRDDFVKNLTNKLSDGPRRFALADVVPELQLVEKIGEDPETSAA